MPDAVRLRSGVIRLRDADNDVEVDLRAGTVLRGGLRARLPQHALEILRILLAAPGEPVSWQALRDRLWLQGSEAEFEARVNDAVRRVREAFGDSADAAHFVETLPSGLGFRFVAPVQPGTGTGSGRASRPATSSGAASGSSDADWTAERLPSDAGRYELLERIGAGAMGEVYRARDLRLDRDVAIKFLPEWMANDPLALHRFRREAHATASLNHPNVLAVYDLAVIDGAPCMVSELLVGHTLRTTLAAGPIQVADAIAYAQQILDGLAAAHGQGIIHRDLKPENVFLTRDGHVKILDFGLAKELARGDGSTVATTATPTTRTGAVLGTLGYQSPEQARGEEVDVRTDLFAFGAVFFELLTGRRPFHRQSEAETIAAMLHEDPPPPGTLNPAVPASCDAIVAKALEKDRELRYQSAAEARADIRRVVRELGGGSSHASESRASAARVPKPARRRGKRMAAWAAVTIVLAAAVWMLVAGGDEMPAFTAIPLTRGTGVDSEPAISPDGNLVAYTSDESGNSDIWLFDVRNRYSRNLTELPSSERHASWAADGSSIYFVSDRGGTPSIWQVPLLGGAPTRIVENAEDVAVSPDGARLAFTRKVNGYYRVFVVSQGSLSEPKQVSQTGNGVWNHMNPAWSPDSTRLCYLANREFWTVPASGGEARRVLARGDYDVDPVWSSDGRALYYSSSRGGGQSLWRATIEPGLRDRLLFWRAPQARPVIGGSAAEQQPTVSRDGRRLVYSTLLEDTNLAFTDLASGLVTRFGSSQNESFPALAPDGSRVFFVSRADPPSNQLWALDLQDGKPLGKPHRLTNHATGNVSLVSCSPDGRWLAYYLVENLPTRNATDTRRTIWIISTAGGSPARLTSGPTDREPTWAPGSDAIAYTSGIHDKSRIWKLRLRAGQADGAPAPVTPGGGDDGLAAWSPDGSLIAFLRTGVDGQTNVRLIKPDGTGEFGLSLDVKPAMVAWDWSVPGGLLVSGRWAADAEGELRRVSALPDHPVPPLPRRTLIEVDRSPFSVTRDGRLLAYHTYTRSGNIWMLETKGSGKF